MRIKLIQPTRYLGRRLYRPGRQLFPSLTLPLLAALAPADAEVTIRNDLFGEVGFDEPADVVGLTAHTPQAWRAYEIAEQFRRRGVHVVLGGIHASMRPDEAQSRVDTVIVGEAEETWPRFLEDFRRGKPQPRYEAERWPDLAGLPAPKFSLLELDRYDVWRRGGIHRLLPTPLLPVQTSRGCPHACEFCSVTAFNGRRLRFRPIGEVVEEIKALRVNGCVFVDDNIFARPERAKELFRALLPLKIAWGGEGGIEAARDPELLDLAARSGCLVMFVGLESLSAGSLAAMGKRQNVAADYEKHLAAFRRAGISVMASLVFGYGGETAGDFQETLAFLERNRVPYTIWWPLTPFPGTGLHERLRREGRLKKEAWWLEPEGPAELADLKFTGLALGEAEFRDCFYRAYERFYSLGGIARRLLLPPQRRCLAKTALNLLFRRRLNRRASIYES